MPGVDSAHSGSAKHEEDEAADDGEPNGPLAVTAVAGTAQLGGPERVLPDFANRACEFDAALKVLTPEPGPTSKA
jgi:hypothetical protein